MIDWLKEWTWIEAWIIVKTFLIIFAIIFALIGLVLLGEMFPIAGLIIAVSFLAALLTWLIHF